MRSKGSIRFFSEEVDFNLPKKKDTSEWIKQAITKEGYVLGEINFIFCSDNYLLNINQQYLNHNTFTDIVTFDNRESPEYISGDIFISIERVKENSIKFHSDFTTELRRVIIHGILHLAGYKDKSKADKEAMKQKEDYYISL